MPARYIRWFAGPGIEDVPATRQVLEPERRRGQAPRGA